MTMTTQPALRRNPWNLVWRFSTGDSSLAVVLLILTVFLLALAVIPQAPADPLSLDLWLIQQNARFGPAAETLWQMGLFSLGESPVLNLLLAATGFLLAVRTVERTETWLRQISADRGSWRKGRFWANLLVVLVHIGPLLLLLGILVGHIWGWRVSGLVGNAGDTVSIPGHGDITLEATADGVRANSSGTLLTVTGDGPQITFRAFDEGDHPLDLQRTPREEGTSELIVALTPQASEIYFAIPEVMLVVRGRLSTQGSLSADSPLHLQVFRAPTGEQVEETEMAEEELTLTLDGVRLQLVRTSYLTLVAFYDPGRWLKVAGLVLGGIALLGLLAWPKPPPERLKTAWVIYRPALALLTLATSGMALRSLVVTGLLGEHAPLQAGTTVLWGMVMAAGLLLYHPDRLVVGEEE
jgi:hypothetical protein